MVLPMRHRLQTEVNATAMEAAGVYLPPELISDVLSRLPVKSIGRFRCVCKDWQSLLSDPQFLKIHFNLQNRRTTKAVLLHRSAFISIDFANNNGGPVAIFETLSSKHNFYDYRCRIGGSCDGLLLLIDKNNSELLIINPITCVSRKLPPVPLRPDYPFFKIYCGFGYNCSDDDDYAYAVVVILEYSRHISLVYVLKRNCWKMAVENPPFAYLYGSSCKYVNGAMHVFGYRIEDYSRILYAFDLASERFREVEQPEGVEEQHVYLLNVLGGCLCLASTSLRNMDTRTTHDIWVMKEYGVSKSWTKYYTFTYDGFTLFEFKPLFLWGGDEFMVGVDDGRVTLCSLNKPQTISVVGEQRPLLLLDRTYWTFTDSLFSPNRNNVVDEPNEV